MVKAHFLAGRIQDWNDSKTLHQYQLDFGVAQAFGHEGVGKAHGRQTIKTRIDDDDDLVSALLFLVLRPHVQGKLDGKHRNINSIPKSQIL